jgi:hypothetical protein
VTNLRQLVENELSKKYNNCDDEHRINQYQKLYPNMNLFENIEDLIDKKNNLGFYDINTKDIDTYIV